ncbi:MAG: histidinol phosphatase [Cytophagaceae bacterium]|nr:histidinol phosphatase [Cytophagaceae bacterium]
MLNLFSKKTFIADLFDGFVDIHNHLLPGLDDGAPDVDIAIQLIQELMQIGFGGSISTPHTMNEYYANTPLTINTAKEGLLKALQENDIHFKLSASSEYMMDGHFQDILKKGEILPLRDRYVLVEMSYLQPPINLDEIIFDITSKEYIPVLAHPERYNYLHQDFSKYTDLKQRGCLFQLNMLALSDYYGSSTKKTAYKFIEDGYYDFIGSDVHHMRHINSLKNMKLTAKYVPAIEGLISKTRETFNP